MHGFAIHMFDAIISLENLFTAWNEFRLGKRSTADVQDFERNLEDILTKLIQDKVSDPNVLRLLHDITNSFMVVDNLIERERELQGIPIGNLTSQLFANVYMNPFDHYVKEVLKVKYYLRYTDDFIMVGQDPDVLMALLPQMKLFLEDQLKLDLHPKKIELRKLRQGIDFLGYIVLRKHQLLRKKTKRRMFRNIRENGLSKPRLNSYLGLLSHGEGYEAEQVLRRRYLEERESRFH